MWQDLSEVRSLMDCHYNNVEFVFSNKCQKACTYCYRVRHQNEGPVFPMSPDDMKRYLDTILKYQLVDTPTDFELFGGDPMLDLSTLSEYLKVMEPVAKHITLPTNGLILENIHDDTIQDLIDTSGGKLFFSLSTDGPVEDIQRPLSKFGKMQGFQQKRNWDRLFHIAEKFNAGFHPMLTFEHADKWFEIWDFFRKNTTNLYLLEVRHPIENLQNAIEGVCQIAKIILTCEKENIKNNFNGTHPSITDRGMSCSALNSLMVHYTGKSYFCHRLLSPKYEIFDFTKEKVDLRKYHLLNTAWHHSNSPTCMKCPIRTVCPGQCQGAIDEYWEGAIGTPIPSVCHYYLLKYYVLSKLSTVWNLEQYVNYDVLEKLVCSIYGNDILSTIERRFTGHGLL